VLEATNISDRTKDEFSMTCVVYSLGLIEYGQAYELQKRLHSARLKGKISDTLLLLEHHPTLTIGKSGSMKNILVSKDKLTNKGIAIFSIDRGGDVTFHGPGQLVGYHIIDLSHRGKDIHRYVHDLEEIIIRTLNDFSIGADSDEGNAGVWVENEEVAAIGLSVRSWVTMHGFALNVNPNLEYFSLINPCGFSDRKATSMSKILGHEVLMEEVTNRLIANLSKIFATQIDTGATEALKIWR
jgi:lipoate-protein ligase B